MTDERTVQEGTGGHQRDDTDVLVHFFGTYDLWVPVLYLLPQFVCRNMAQMLGQVRRIELRMQYRGPPVQFFKLYDVPKTIILGHSEIFKYVFSSFL